MNWIVREEFMQPGFDTPTRRHYRIAATSREEAVRVVRSYRENRSGVIYGCVPGSKVFVVAAAA